MKQQDQHLYIGVLPQDQDVNHLTGWEQKELLLEDVPVNRLISSDTKSLT